MTEENQFAVAGKPVAAAVPADKSAQPEQKEKFAGIVKPTKKKGGTKGHLVLIIIIAILILLLATAFIGKSYLTKRALLNQANYEQICVRLKGEIALFIDGDERSLHCVSSMFNTKDENRACVSQSECQGACVGDTSDTIYVPPDVTEENKALIPPVHCSGGIRLLPQFDVPELEPEA